MKNVLVVIFYSLLSFLIIGGFAANPIQEDARESKIADQFKGIWIGAIEVYGETSSRWDEEEEDQVEENVTISIKLEILDDKIIQYLKEDEE
jgi:hypothetical protein